MTEHLGQLGLDQLVQMRMIPRQVRLKIIMTHGDQLASSGFKWPGDRVEHLRELVRRQLKVLAEHGVAGSLAKHSVTHWTAEADKWCRVATTRLRADGQI